MKKLVFSTRMSPVKSKRKRIVKQDPIVRKLEQKKKELTSQELAWFNIRMESKYAS